MRKLKANERIIKEYDRYILIEVACPHEKSYRTTIDKWTSKDEARIKRERYHTLNSSFQEEICKTVKTMENIHSVLT